MKIFRLLLVFSLLMFGQNVGAQFPEVKSDLDKKVYAFLTEQSGEWQDMNVPVSDGRILYDLVIQGNYKKALEIGTSTGHSAIWIAWALSKTGGKLVTIEIEKERYLQAMRNFRKAGLFSYIDARLGNAHELVPMLEAGWDFVFCDADKWWYKNYFTTLENKIVSGGCFTAHNVNMQSSDIREFKQYIQNHPKFVTSYKNESRSGISVSVKK
ncbi:MAG TPA: class I SAM-dependent methyltransferase [Prolixibacteraceae bacterium]|nr:class I SAM-dependent methyltransferase [Prolixibacteraceae bacterium]